jgi:hypothetical protein
VLCLYVGGAAYSYPDYLDAATGRMLEPHAGDAAVYDVRVAPGRNSTLPLPPGDGRWIAVSALEPQAEPEPEVPAEVAPDGAENEPGAPEGEPAPEDQGAPEGEPETPAEEATDHTEGVE